MAKYAQLSWKALATGFGIFWGVYLGLAALFAMSGVTFIWFSPAFFGTLTSIYPGLAATGIGVVLGLVYGFICGAICGGLIAGLYNWALPKFK